MSEFEFNPLTGQFEISQAATETAKRLEANFIAGETIVPFRLFYLNASEQAIIGNPSSYLTAQVIGLSLTSANTGEEFTGLLFGKLDDASLTFSSNVSIFLGSGGTLTSVVPTSGMRTKVAQGLYSGSIFFKVENTIQLA